MLIAFTFVAVDLGVSVSSYLIAYENNWKHQTMVQKRVTNFFQMS
jgi:hypothetical protein